MFREIHSKEERCAEANRIIEKYPDRIPIIVQKNTTSSSETLPDLTKTKFLVPEHVTFGQFLYIIRTRMSLPAEKALYIFVNNTIPNSSSDMKTLYDEHKDDDNFLYCFYGTESTFGC
jgi:GABA(A) receptor-associated protein